MKDLYPSVAMSWLVGSLITVPWFPASAEDVNKTLTLPEPVACFFKSAESADTVRFPQCFSPHAIVTVQGTSIEGRTRIGRWGYRDLMGGHYRDFSLDASSTPQSVGIDVTFAPGPRRISQWRCHYQFHLGNNQIEALVITRRET